MSGSEDLHIFFARNSSKPFPNCRKNTVVQTGFDFINEKDLRLGTEKRRINAKQTVESLTELSCWKRFAKVQSDMNQRLIALLVRISTDAFEPRLYFAKE